MIKYIVLKMICFKCSMRRVENLKGQSSIITIIISIIIAFIGLSIISEALKGFG